MNDDDSCVAVAGTAVANQAVLNFILRCHRHIGTLASSRVEPILNAVCHFIATHHMLQLHHADCLAVSVYAFSLQFVFIFYCASGAHGFAILYLNVSFTYLYRSAKKLQAISLKSVSGQSYQTIYVLYKWEMEWADSTTIHISKCKALVVLAWLAQ